MELGRLRAGEWIAAASGVLLVVSLSLPWYTVEVPHHPAVGGRRIEGKLDFSAWEVFSVVDVLLLVVGMLAIGLLILTAVQPTAAVPIAADALVTIVAGVVSIVTLVRVLDIPASLEVPDRLAVEVHRAPFAWIGLAAVLGVLAGVMVAMRDERLSRPDERTDATGMPMDAPAPIETLPAPPRGSGDE